MKCKLVNKLLLAYLDDLDKIHRAVLTLRYFDDLSYKEIAQVLIIPEGTVKSTLNTAIELLHEEALKGGLNHELQKGQ